MAENFHLHDLGRLAVLDWVQTPTTPAIDEMRRQLERMLERGQPLAFMSIIREGTAAPSSEVREHMLQAFKVLVPRFRAHCSVIEGKGLAADAKRLFTRAALALLGQRSPIFESVEAAFQSPLFVPDAGLQAEVLSRLSRAA